MLVKTRRAEFVNYFQNEYFRESILVDPDVFVRAKKKKIKGSKVIYVAIPVVAYKYEIKTNAHQEDFLREAVCNLRDYYCNIGNENCINEISHDLGLSPILVKSILKDDEQSESVIEGEEGQRRTVSTNKFVVLYNKIANAYIPITLPIDQYESMKDQCEDFSAYQTSIGDSTKYFIHEMRLTPGHDKHPYNPNQEEVSTLFRQRASKHNRKTNEIFNLLYTGISDEFYLITAVYYDKNNAFEYCAENPFRSGRASWVVKDIAQYLKEQHPNCNKLDDSLKKLKESVDIDSIKTTERKNTLRLSCEELIDKTYDKKSLSKIPELKERLVITLVSYSEMIHFCQNEDSEENFVRIDDARQKYYVAVSNLIEKIIASVFLNHYQESNRKKYMDYLSQVESSDYCIYDYRKLANSIGFNENAIDGKIKLSIKTLDWVMVHQDDTQDINSLLFACLLEALFEENHPFHAWAEKYPDFFEYLCELKELRDPSKHGAKDEIRWNNFDLQKLAFEMFNLFILEPIVEAGVVDSSSLINHEEIDENYKHLDLESQSELKKYQHLWLNSDSFNLALAMQKAFISQDGEYATKVYNLLDEVTKQLVVCIANGTNEIQREIINKILGDIYNQEDIATKSSEILLQYGCEYIFKNRYSEDNFKKTTYSGALTFGNRIYYFIILADYKKPEFFRRFLIENPNVFAVIEQITGDEGLRGHNNLSDFEKQDLKGFNEEVLELCEHIATYIEEFEEEK